MSLDPQWLVGILLMLIFALIGLVHRNMNNALDAKASADALREVKEHFRKELERLHQDYLDRVKELSQRQDREIDSIRSEMVRITDGLESLRRDVSQGNANVLERLQEVALQIRRQG